MGCHLISVVCWLWRETGRDFRPAHVNVLQRMMARHLPAPHRFICVADSAAGFDPGVEVYVTPQAARDVGRLRNPEGPRFPSCYRRLWMFSRDARELGEVVLVLDIDLVVTGDLASVVARQEPFVGWRPRMTWGGPDRIGGGIYLLRTGLHTEVWDSFRGQSSISAARAAGYRGSDQAWLSYRLGSRCAVWSERSGLYSIRDMRDGRLPLPSDALLVQFNGPTKPWTSQLGWVKSHWR